MLKREALETIKRINSNSLKGIANIIIISFLIGIIFSYLFLGTGLT